MPDADQNKKDLQLLTDLGHEAGKIALKWFGADPKVWMKEGDSPVSEADFAVDQFLKEKLLEARPSYGWLSEETDDNEARLDAERVFVVDPIDGTRGFINGMKRWCVSIAVVENNAPVVGVLECPVMEQTITARLGGGAQVNGKIVQAADPAKRESIRVTGPRALETALKDIQTRPIDSKPFVPSLAYRLAMVAMDELDLAIARASAKDWDLAAADLIVHEAGAILTDIAGDRLKYNCRDVRHGALVASAANQHGEMLEIARQAKAKIES